MWKYSQINAYDSISLHDCRTDNIKLEGKDLIINFPDGFWITPSSHYIDHDRPLKTGPSQLRFIGITTDPYIDSVIDSVDLYKTTRLLGKPVFCRRIQPRVSDFLALVNNGKHELEFFCEYHSYIQHLYQGWGWKKNKGMTFDWQLQLTAKSIEYRWNEICKDREW